MHIAKTIEMDAYLFFINSMLYKMHEYIKMLSQLMHFDLNICFKINKTKYERDYKLNI